MFKANWISTGDMLPAEEKHVLVTCRDYHGNDYVWLAKRIESFKDERGWCWLFTDGNTDTDWFTPVYAWMPLPKPFGWRDGDLDEPHIEKKLDVKTCEAIVEKFNLALKQFVESEIGFTNGGRVKNNGND